MCILFHTGATLDEIRLIWIMIVLYLKIKTGLFLMRVFQNSHI